jgi:hypothetical protein
MFAPAGTPILAGAFFSRYALAEEYSREIFGRTAFRIE